MPHQKGSIKQQNLRKILLGKYLPSGSIDPAWNTADFRGSVYEKDFLEAYEELGGRLPFPEFIFHVPLMEFGRFCVLLDEAIRFNRYRAKTLRSDFYENLMSFPLSKYRSYCRKYETECIKAGTAGRLWTSDVAEQHFGSAQAPGDLGLSGSPGWKLTALKDLATDMLARKKKIRLLRIAVWDDLLINGKLVKINELLMSPEKHEQEAILKFVERRMVGLYADDL